MLELSFSQCKQAIESGIDLRDLQERFNDQPEFIKETQVIDWNDAQAILQGGCENGAYMPAVTYNTAQSIMNQYSDNIEAVFEEFGYGAHKMTWYITEEPFASFCVKVVSRAVELWVSQFAEELENIGWS